VATDPASLDNLIDIVLPAPVPVWPPAPGWYVVAAALVLAAAWGGWHAWTSWRAAAYRRAALAELERLRVRAADDGTRGAALQALPLLVKRTALAAFAREQVAALSGGAWLAFLDRTGCTDAFSSGDGRALVDVAYDPAAAARLDARATAALFRVVRQWIEGHVAMEAG
jgi:hypothetical protein